MKTIGQVIEESKKKQRETAQRYVKILSLPGVTDAIADAGLPILQRQRFLAPYDEMKTDLVRSLEKYRDGLASFVGGGNDNLRSVETELAIRVVNYIRFEDYDIKQYGVIVVDDIVQGVWDLEYYKANWAMLTLGMGQHQHYYAEFHVTVHLGKKSAYLQLNGGRGMMNGTKAIEVALEAVNP